MAMTYEKIFSEVKKEFKKTKTSHFTESFAFQFNITGEGEGIFYVEFKNGVLSIEPYDYKDRDVIFEADGKTLIDIASGKTEPIDAIKLGKLSIDGNHELAKQLIFLAGSEKTAPKKPASAKAVEKKTASKPAAKAEPNTETKSAVKAESKPAAKTATKAASKPKSKSAAKAKK